MLDVIQNVDEKKKVHYFWIDTGLEYRATKEHLDYLEKKYDITIERIKACKPIPACCKEYGQPFLSKYVSEQIMRLQMHGFQWEDKPLPELLRKYPNCKIALQWWCNAYYTPENGIVRMSRFSINRNRWLKEFMIANPPNFRISNKCCEYAKKKPAKLLIQKYDADLEIIGVRKAEAESVLPATRRVFPRADQRAAIPIDRYSGIRTATRKSMRNSMGYAFPVLYRIWNETHRLRGLSVQSESDGGTGDHSEIRACPLHGGTAYFR